MKLIKKMGIYVLLCCLVTGSCAVWSPDITYGEETKGKIEAVDVYLKPAITVRYEGDVVEFKDATGASVYPIIYEGKTYLPLRGLCSLVEKAVEWDDQSKTIFMGKTFSDPAGITKGTTECAVRMKEPIGEKRTEQRVKGKIRPDVLVMYNFEQQEIKDSGGNVLYPLVYQETTYLPTDAIAKCLRREISLDPLENTITLGVESVMAMPGDDKAKQWATGAAIESMNKIFHREKEIYNDISGKIVELVKVKDKKEKQAIAKAISDDYIMLEKVLLMTKGQNLSAYTEEEQTIHKELVAFSDSFSMYALVIENVAYMAAAGEDYALLSETLLYYALESQELMAKVSLK